MSTSIRLKKSSISGRVPASNDLEYGELAINYADGIIYFKNSSNTIQSINATPNGIDSTATINLIDSAYVQARQSTDTIFKTISVSGQSDVVADTTTDALTLVAGSGMTITTDASADTVTFASPASVGVDYGSIIVQATNAIDILMAAFTIDYGTPTSPAGLKSDYGTI